MVTIEIIVILIGVIFLIGSFMLKDKLSAKEVDQIAKLSEEELKIIVEKQLASAKNTIDDAIDVSIEESKEKTIRAMEKESNEKILSISEYSDTVLESMNKTHNEIMFLYSMLNDKHKDLTEYASELQSLSDKISNFEIKEKVEILEQNDIENRVDENEAFVTFVASQQKKNPNVMNNNNDILELHQSGKTDIEIAKELGLGLGEVKLVIGLYKGEETDEI